MVEGELEGGFDDQLMDEAILGRWKGKERGGNWEEEERFGSDDEEEKRSG